MNYNYGSYYNPGTQPQNFQQTNPGMLGYNQSQPYPTRPPPQIGFNLLLDSNQCALSTCYGYPSNEHGIGYNAAQNGMNQTYNSSPNIGTGWYSNTNTTNNVYPAPNIPIGSYPIPNQTFNNYDPSTINYGNYHNPPSLTNGTYDALSNISSGVPVINMEQNSNLYNSDYNSKINPRHPLVNPSAPLGNVSGNETTYAATDVGQNQHISRINKDNDSKLKIQTSKNKSAYGSTITDKQKSSDYQKGLDKLASLMNEDIDLSDDVLRKNREKYDLNVSHR